MAGRGPLPSTSASKSRKRSDRIQPTTLTVVDGGGEGGDATNDVPPFPGGAMSERAKAVWTAVWSMPHPPEWIPDAVHHQVVQLVHLEDQFAVAQSIDAQLRISAELRSLRNALLITPEAMRRAKIDIERKPKAVAEPARTATRRRDPRARS